MTRLTPYFLLIGLAWLNLSHAAFAQPQVDKDTKPPPSEQTEPATEPLPDSELTEAEKDAPVAALAPTAIDKNIKTDLEQIFAQDKTLNSIMVRVRAGVVTLTGDVPNEGAATEAKRLATEADNVVKVQDEMVRTLALTDNVAPLIATAQKAVISFIRAIPLIILALLTLCFFVFLGNRIIRLQRVWSKIAPNPFLAELLGQAARIFLVTIGLVLTLNILGAGKIVTAVLGGAGVIGIAIGFAVRDTIENYIASIMLSLRQPFRGGDHVLIDNHEGKVVRLTSRATILMTLDGNHLRIPNSQVFKGVILNYTTNPDRKFSFELGVDATDDPIAAINTGIKAIAGLDFVLDEPKPSAVINQVGDSNTVLKFSGWVNQTETDFGKARSFAIRAATTILETNGFSLPEPIYRLRLDSVPAKLVAALPMDSAKTKDMTPLKDESGLEPPAPNFDASSVDVAPDKHLDEKLEEERTLSGKDDLLDSDRPVE